MIIDNLKFGEKKLRNLERNMKFRKDFEICEKNLKFGKDLEEIWKFGK